MSGGGIGMACISVFYRMSKLLKGADDVNVSITNSL